VIKKLVFITALIVVTVLAVNFVNSHPRTAVFNACPGTEYCSKLGRIQQSDPVHIRYKGWPFKVKIGNPDWCENDACEVNNFHPGYKGEFFVYNAIVLSVPVLSVIAIYLYRADRRLAGKLLKGVMLIGVSVLLGWFTMSTLHSHAIRQSYSKETGMYETRGGLPLSTTLGIGYGCSSTVKGTDAIDCARSVFQDNPVWHSESRSYINWAFWTIVWAVFWVVLAVFEYKVKKYAHHRH
jgi:hypothetical protein